MGLVLRGLGYEVTIAYLPYSSWEKEINALDLRRQDLYTRKVLTPLDGLLRFVSLLGAGPSQELPETLRGAVGLQSDYDAMYSLQNEHVNWQSRLYRLRVERNGSAMSSALRLLAREKPDAVLVPNGLITELGVLDSSRTPPEPAIGHL